MTSKELLEHIRNAPSFMGGDARYEATTNSPEAWNEDIAQIERDLEVLDILKPFITLPNEFEAPLIFGKEYKEKRQKIKEWLEND